MNQLLLIDYAEVLSKPFSDDSMTSLARQLHMDVSEFKERYWEYRAPYDRGQSDRDYWETVAGRELDDDTLATLIKIDVDGWTDLDPRAEGWLSDLNAAGSRPWLLSNAPHPLADAVELLPLTSSFAGLLFSCRIGEAKPSAQCFSVALKAMGATPECVTFIDDRQTNIEAAARLGLNTYLFTGNYPQPDHVLHPNRAQNI
ncbi:HAD-IA family hydrolase [Devriesea agamarum]|uniref:HAD-IA family hydrolase n=1 Tax=Devriesea agamarum TaxID=472569 RepID=UPI00071C3E48|nr:HAD-IA family hydrolase [Devriesea agamarum]